MSKVSVIAMHNNSESLLLKALETTLRKFKVCAIHNNIGIALLVAINFNWTGGGVLIPPPSSFLNAGSKWQKAIELKLGHFSQMCMHKIWEFKNWKKTVSGCYGNQFVKSRLPVKNERVQQM